MTDVLQIVSFCVFANICRYTIELFGEGAVFVIIMAEILFKNDGQQGDMMLILKKESLMTLVLTGHFQPGVLSKIDHAEC